MMMKFYFEKRNKNVLNNYVTIHDCINIYDKMNDIMDKIMTSELNNIHVYYTMYFSTVF